MSLSTFIVIRIHTYMYGTLNILCKRFKNNALVCYYFVFSVNSKMFWCILNNRLLSVTRMVIVFFFPIAGQYSGNLTWRDVQHLLARNCEVAPLAENPGWSTNGAGFVFNPQFGFGLLNAYKLVNEAIGWSNVPEKSICAVDFSIE